MDPNDQPSIPPRPPAARPATVLVRRHSVGVRLMHWVNALALTVLLMSGLMIFNAHPSLDWGRQSYSGKPSVLAISARDGGNGRTVGVMQVLGREFDTTGVLGVSSGVDGRPHAIAFPSWITIPSSYSLASGRLWHFFFAWLLVLNGAAYIVHSLLTRHLQRDLWPTLADWRGIGRSILDHIAFRHPHGQAARRYNILQKLAYLIVILVLLPLVILGGWAMSPGMDAFLPGWVDLMGGRQAARTVHFIVAWLLVAFVAIHVFEVLISGVFNQLRSMITGRYRISADDTDSNAPGRTA